MAECALSGGGPGASPGNSSRNSLVSRRHILAGLAAVPAFAVPSASAAVGATPGDDQMNMLTQITAAPSSDFRGSCPSSPMRLKGAYLKASQAANDYWARTYKPTMDRATELTGRCPSGFGGDAEPEYVAWYERALAVESEPRYQAVSSQMDRLWDEEASAADAFMGEPARDAETLATKLLIALDTICSDSYEAPIRRDYRDMLIADAKRLNGEAASRLAS